MFAKISIMAVVLALSAAPVLALDFSNPSLASYEPQEVGDLNVSPVLPHNPNCLWPVPGGVNGAPEATYGNYVLKMVWENETDRKIAVKHHWNNSTFDLVDVNYILVDVYVATESALPEPNKNNVSIWSIWGSNQHWISCESVPPAINEWYTVGFYVGNLHYENQNDINALTFENMPGTAGTIYIDNLRLLHVEDGNWPNIRRKIKFSGHWWSLLQSIYQIGAGPNCYTDDQNDVYVDANGHLHLSVKYKDANTAPEPNWYCSEVIANDNLGYGTYVFTVGQEVDSLDPNIIAGLFIFDVNDENDRPREIDVELTRWGNPTEPNVGQFVVQPWYHTGNVYRFPIEYPRQIAITTHEIKWIPARVDFRSYYGDYSPNPPVQMMISSWSYTGPDIPRQTTENPRINFYLAKGAPPQNGQNAEIVIKSFHYIPLGDLDSDGDVDFMDFSLFADKWLWGKD